MPQQPNIEPVTVAQLDIVNDIIAAAVLGWPMAARLKRVAVGVLTYDAMDLREMEMLLARLDGAAAGVAAWDATTALHGRAGWRGALLHGLYPSATSSAAATRRCPRMRCAVSTIPICSAFLWTGPSARVTSPIG